MTAQSVFLSCFPFQLQLKQKEAAARQEPELMDESYIADAELLALAGNSFLSLTRFEVKCLLSGAGSPPIRLVARDTSF